MAPLSTIRLFGCSSRKREAEQAIADLAIVFSAITISVAVVFVILSGGVSVAIEWVAESFPA
jgi:hypothetical protein